MYKICEGIHEKQKKEGLKGEMMGAIDIGCGYHSYLFAIARWKKQVNLFIICILVNS